jgi:hypothetical protein
VAVIVTGLQWWLSRKEADNSLDPAVLPEAFLSLTVAPIRPEDLDAIWFLPDNWAFSVLAGPASGAGHSARIYQSAAAFRLILTSALPPGTAEPIVETVALVVLGRQGWAPRTGVRTYLFTGGGADSPISFADFARTEAPVWPLRWRPERENEFGYAAKPEPLKFKYLRSGESIVFLVSEAPSVSGPDSHNDVAREEFLEVAARADFLIGGLKRSVFSRERLLLLGYRHSARDALDRVDISGIARLQSASTLGDPDAPGLVPESSTMLREWKAFQMITGLRGGAITKSQAAANVRGLVETKELSGDERARLRDLLDRLGR